MTDLFIINTKEMPTFLMLPVTSLKAVYTKIDEAVQFSDV